MVYTPEERRAKRLASQRAWKTRNPDKVKAQKKRRNARIRASPELKQKRVEAGRKWRDRNPHRVEVLWRRLEAQKEAERIAVAGRPRPDTCEVCGREGKIVFDHCHKNGRFRGWLCDSCNVVLGRANDDPVILRKLAAYLERDIMISELPLFAQQS